MRINKMLMSLLLISAVGTTMAFATQNFGAGPVSVVTSDKASVLRALMGKKVLGKYREFLGYIISVDERDRMISLKTPTGAAVPVPTNLLSVEEDHVRALTLSRGDILALIRETGQAGVLEVHAVPSRP